MSQSIAELTKEIISFRDLRDWHQFHTLKNLMASLAIEASEVLELGQWKNDEELRDALVDDGFREALADECADVFAYLLMICHETEINLADAMRAKLAKNAAKYPVDQAYGSATKYTDIGDGKGRIS